MRTALLALFGIAAMSLGAKAADMPVKAIPAEHAYSWTGCYGGLNAGGATTKLSQTDSTSFPGLFFDFGSGTGTGGVAGGQIGCDYQTGNWVLGARAMWDLSSIDYLYMMAPATPFANSNVKSKYFGTAVARVGYAVMPNALVYVNGGGAWIKNNIDVFIAGALSESVSYSATGWTVGLGGEYYLGAGFSLFGEVDYMNFGTKRVCYTQAPGAVFAGIPCMAGGGNAMDIKQDVKAVVLGANYRFKGF
jgi:outer membrane immunogenic protein